MGDNRILAAGGLLWRDRSRRELCVVHRHRHGDWCLPKGKLEDGETLADAALREVREETGYRVEIVGEAGECRYRVGERDKSVVFFHMLPIDPEPAGLPDPDEVAEVSWLTVAEARRRLDHAGERVLL